jgi:predicted nucleotidyltransferase
VSTFKELQNMSKDVNGCMAAFAEQVQKELVRDNAYLQEYLQDEEEWDTRQPTLDEAKQCLLNDENLFLEFLTETSMRKHTYNLLREIVGEII